MKEASNSLERFNAFSDGIFGVLITILVLDIKVPDGATPGSLLPLWPTGLSYAVSYLFVAIVWVNHHHLLRHADVTTPFLIWSNFAHLFAASFVLFLTGWIAKTRLAPFPVSLYAADFVLVNITYIALCWEIVDRPAGMTIRNEVRKNMHLRSFSTLGVFTLASVMALKWPIAGMGLICCCLLAYVRPEAPGIKQKNL